MRELQWLYEGRHQPSVLKPASCKQYWSTIIKFSQNLLVHISGRLLFSTEYVNSFLKVLSSEF